MSQNSVRQNYFRILSRLYDLASEFSAEELDEVRRAFVERGNPSHAMVVGALIEIHNNTPVGTGRVVLPPLPSASLTERDASDDLDRQRASSERRKLIALRNVLMMPEIFKGINDIAEIRSVRIKPKHKESRERYVKRVMSSYGELPASSQKEFRKDVAEYAARRSSHSFVSKWSTLIKDL